MTIQVKRQRPNVQDAGYWEQWAQRLVLRVSQALGGALADRRKGRQRVCGHDNGFLPQASHLQCKAFKGGLF
jgi:hypothetical protein